MQAGVLWRDDPFMTVVYIDDPELWVIKCGAFFDQWDAYNVHFLQHLIHAFGVCGIHHPNIAWRDRCWKFYEYSCTKLHMHPETRHQLAWRLRDGVRTDAGEVETA